MPPVHLLKHFVEWGGPLAVIGALVGGYLWHPECSSSITFNSSSLLATTTQVCHNTWGPLAAGDATNWAIARGALYGALAGVIVAVLLVSVFNVSRRDIGLED